MSPKNLSKSLKSKFFYFSLFALLSSIFVNYYLLNVDYDVNSDWLHGSKFLPAPVFNFVSRKIMSIPSYILPPDFLLSNLMSEHLTLQALRQVSELGIADIIKQKGGRLSVKELSELTNTNEESLNRFLRALSASGIFYHHGNGVYSNSRLSSVLRKDHPNSLKYLLEFSLSDLYEAAVYLGEALKYPNGWDDLDLNNNNKEDELTTPFKKAFGANTYEFFNLPENKYRRERFDRAMVSGNGFVADEVFVDYDWGLNESSVVVDVGGGNGGMTLEILKRYKTKGIVYDFPQVLEITRKIWNEKHKDLLDRVEFVPGSFLKDPIPKGDVYVLRWILHNWSDTSSVKILKNIRSSIPSSNSTSTPVRLVILEGLLDEPADRLTIQMDLIMSCIVFGKERTSKDFSKILEKGGWKYTKTIYCRGMFSLIEAVPNFDY